MTKRKIIVYIATSADGYIARPDGSVDWLNRPRTAGDYGMAASSVPSTRSFGDRRRAHAAPAPLGGINLAVLPPLQGRSGAPPLSCAAESAPTREETLGMMKVAY